MYVKCMSRRWCVLFVWAFVSWVAAIEPLEMSGVSGGLVVHLGCGEGPLTIALGTDRAYVVQGLDRNRKNIDLARSRIMDAKQSGRVSVALLEGPRLPYVENLVNVLVVEDGAGITTKEMMRVLAPEGVLCMKKDGKWRTAVKPRPDTIDAWTHYLYDASNNAVSKDHLVGPPQHMQWKAGPEFARHHDFLSSTSSQVSDGKRIFYIFDEGMTTSLIYPPKWKLIARDAFNGTLLWKQPIDHWVDYLRKFRSGPQQLARRLVTAEGKVFVTLGLSAPVSVLDSVTGTVLTTYAGTEFADEIIYIDGMLFVVVLEGSQSVSDELRRGDIPGVSRKIVALNSRTGKTLWTSQENVVPRTLAATTTGVFGVVDGELVGLDCTTGTVRWRQKIGEVAVSKSAKNKKKGKGRKLKSGGYTLITDQKSGMLFLAHDEKLSAHTLADGTYVWGAGAASGFLSDPDIMLADGLLWIGSFATEGHDPATGEVKRSIDIGDLLIDGHHARCYRNKATDDYLMYGRHGIDFFNIKSSEHDRAVWARGVCQYGIMPCNGLIYMNPNACGCYDRVMLRGLNALASARGQSSVREAPVESRLRKGPAYGQVKPEKRGAADWPTYRHNGARSGATPSPISAQLTPAWKTELGGKLTQPVVANGKLYVASVHEHTLYVLDESSGKVLWRFTAGGRIDTPPSVANGIVYFGSRDGTIHALRAADGVEVWTFQAAPERRMVMANEQVESVWPVGGNVLLQNGLVYACAGRSPYLDRGLFLYGLDALTGEPVHQAKVDHSRKTDNAEAFTMDGVKADILTGDGTHIFLKDLVFTADLKPEKERVAHLFSQSGFVDDAWFYRSLWVLGYGTPQAIGNIYANLKYDVLVPFGQLLCYDEQMVYGLQTANPNSIQKKYVSEMSGCRLFGGDVHPLSPGWNKTPDQDDFPKGQGNRNRKKWPTHHWETLLPFQARAMVLTPNTLFVAGWPDAFDEDDPYAAPEGRKGGVLWSVTTAGKKQAEWALPSPPVFDGMVVANGRLYLSLKNGTITCFQSEK